MSQKNKSELINKVKSLYILDGIFNYIKDENFKIKLFLHSKSLQKKIGIKIYLLQEEYLKSIGFNINDYLHIDEENYKRKILTEKYNDFFLGKKIKKKTINNIVFNIFNNKKVQENGTPILINIYSPLLEVLIKTKNFEKFFTFFISQSNIEEFKLKKNYINFFDKLNKSKIKNYSICLSSEDINCLKELKINLNKINRLTLMYKGINQPSVFFDNIFKFKELEQNLIYLNIDFSFNHQSKLETALFEKINDFKSLKYLFISCIEIDSPTIKLNNMKELYFYECENIRINNIFCNQLEKLDIIGNSLIDFEYINFGELKKLKELNLSYSGIGLTNILELLNFEKLEKIILEYNCINGIESKNVVIFKELKELNISHNEISDLDGFEKIKCEKLEILNLEGNFLYDLNLIENLDFKELKELNLSYNNIADISQLKEAKFEKLEKLYLSKNISDINILEYVNFKNLKNLILYNNQIKDISVLENVDFRKLEILNLCDNKISDIDCLENCNFKELKSIDLSNNEIQDIEVLKKLILKNWKNYFYLLMKYLI